MLYTRKALLYTLFTASSIAHEPSGCQKHEDPHCEEMITRSLTSLNRILRAQVDSEALMNPQ
jgi:hypothetical protein